MKDDSGHILAKTTCVQENSGSPIIGKSGESAKFDTSFKTAISFGPNRNPIQFS